MRRTALGGGRGESGMLAAVCLMVEVGVCVWRKGGCGEDGRGDVIYFFGGNKCSVENLVISNR